MRQLLAAAVLALMASQASASNYYDVLLFNSTNSCRSCDLSGEYFAETNHPYSDLYNADVRSVSFFHANLDHASFKYAKAKSILLQSAYLVGADFSSAVLQYADLTASNGANGNFYYADLRYGGIGGLYGSADFTSADMRSSTFYRYYDDRGQVRTSDFSRAIFNGTDLSSAYMGYTSFVGADFRNAYLYEAILDYANLGGSNMSYYQLSTAHSYCGAILPDWSQAPYCEATAPEADAKIKGVLKDN